MPLLKPETGRENGTPRTRTASTKMTKSELAAFEDFARERDTSPGELIRELIFREMNAGQRTSTGDSTLQEVVGVQLLLMNVLKPVATGQALTAEAFDKIVAEVHKVKGSVARRVLKEGK